MTQELLEKQVLKHMLVSKSAINKCKNLNITKDHFVWKPENSPLKKSPTTKLFDMIIDYYNIADSLFTYNVMENKLIDSRQSDLVKESYAVLWQDIQSQEIDENNLHEWCMQLRKNKAVKEVGELFVKGQEKISTEGLENAIQYIDDQVDSVKNELSDVFIEKHNFSLNNASEYFQTEYLKRIRNKDKYTGIPSGFSLLDNKTHGWFGGQVVVFLGPSAGGKSTMLLNLAHNAFMSKKNVLYFSFEMDAWTCLLRHISRLYEIDVSFLRGLNLDDDRVAEIAKKLNDLPKDSVFDYFISDENATAEYVESKIKEYIMADKFPDIVVIDQIANMTTEKTPFNADLWRRGGDAIVYLESVAKKYNITILTAQQFSTYQVKDTKKQKQEGKARQYYQDAASGDQRLIHKAFYVIAMEPDVQNNICTLYPVKMRESWFKPFVLKWDSSYSAVLELSDDEQSMWQKTLGLEFGDPMTIKKDGGSIIDDNDSNQFSNVIEVGNDEIDFDISLPVDWDDE